MNEQELLSIDKKYVWHPYTQMKDYENRKPILIDRAKGVKLYDASGKFYYDIISSWWCNILGHNRPEINKAIAKQLRHFEHTLFAGFTNKPAIQLADKLIGITHPNLQKVFYADNGSTANEVALKMSFQYWKNKGAAGKESFIFLENGYHGDTIGAMSVSGVSQFNNVFKPLFFKAHQIPSPYCYYCPFSKQPGRCDFECLAPLEKLLQDKADEIAAIIIEPLMQGAGGIIIYPPEYLNRLYDIVKKYDIHIILDEVATGFGRTGKMFAYEHTRLVPDFLCVSKALTNGTLPLSAVITTNAVYNAFYDDYSKNKTFFHGHTYTGNPISCSAAVATLDVLEKSKLIEKSKDKIEYLNKLVKPLERMPHIGEVRQLGFIVAFEIVLDKERKTRFLAEKRIGWNLYLEGLKNNLILRPLGDVVYLYLPLTVTKKELNDIIARLSKTLRILQGAA